MTRKYYQKSNTRSLRKKVRILGLCLFSIGLLGFIYIFFPIFSLELFIVPALATNTVASPIPNASILSSVTLQSLWENATKSLTPTDYSNAANWYPSYNTITTVQTVHQLFYLSIPSLGIENAIASNADNDLDHHLVNYEGTATPPDIGNAVVFGHSTLPQWFDPHNYKAIFATLDTIKNGAKIIITKNDVSYTYVIDKISIVDADDTSPLDQQYDGSYLTLITCTPPGTTWKRLIVHSQLEKLTSSSLQ